MELVYLWVEEYKNIEKQGFNFSPRFDCDYDEESNKLTVDEKETYVSIFPDNINITAIVGENGSGKSSILEVFSKILTLDNDFNEFKYFYVLNNGLENIGYSNNVNILDCDITIEKHIPMQMLSGKIDNGNSNDKVAFTNYFDVSYLNISHLERESIIKNDVPSPQDPIEYYGIYAKNDFNLYNKSPLYSNFSGFELSQFNFFQTYTIGNLLTDKKYKDLFFKVFQIKQPYSLNVEYIEEDLEKIRDDNRPNKDLSIAVDSSVPKKIDKILTLLIKNNGNLIIESVDYKTFFTLIASVYKLEKEFKLTFQTKDNKDIKLSSGEKTILFYLERIDFMLSKFDNKDNILLFDEVELYLHPNWQKKILKIIFDFIQENNLTNNLTNNLHIILASHSPFILSDLPKENVIFLENGEQKDKFKDKQTFGANIHTLLSDGFFMSDGLMGEFAKGKIEEIKKFYELVIKCEKIIKKSERIKSKIKNIYKEYEVNFRHIQSIIGEPFLQIVIKNYLDELDILFNGKNQFLDNEIERLKALKD